MASRFQFLRSSTPNTKPLANTGAAGEIWTNFADLQFGLIDPTRTAVPLVAVRYFAATTAYSSGDFVVQAGKIYVAKAAVPVGPFNATQWTQLMVSTDASAIYMPLTGGAFTGAVTMSANAASALQPTTLQQMNAAIPGASAISPPMDGAATAGAATTWSRGDHCHPTDTSRYAASNPSGFQTAAQVNAVAANYLPLSGGTVSGSLAITGAGSTGGSFVAGGSVVGSPVVRATGSAGNNGGGFTYWDHFGSQRINMQFFDSTGQFQINNMAPGPNSWIALPNGGSFDISSATANKPGGGSWTATSDVRIKNVEAEYKTGLEEVVKLKPVIYSYKGNDAPAEGRSPHEAPAGAGTKFVGLVAQEVEQVFPGMVTKGPGTIDGVEVDDLRALDTTPLIFALINAVKTLTARIQTLEGAATLK